MVRFERYLGGKFNRMWGWFDVFLREKENEETKISLVLFSKKE